MVFDSLRERMGGHDNLSPMQIAHNTLFTAKEKIDLLHQLKAEVTSANANGNDVGFSADEIDAAIAEVRQGAENDVGADTVLKGDF
ncbi:hypothetical protein PSC71_08950 [Devosia sp. J2-20]|jgi:hypothetical protein|uniref:Uncharacterized protein n=1 Tax=Devosia litorisediminis TaxID=2829817 RepID=A0A942I5W5_9HYPH|nr:MULTISPECIES: hypothetical protein [Devosia]MBS3849516.1 hypothetical protein [Devosia litorisediminis]WDR00847.1 hypothetical protein PSC71_08950 [Devosia sp. J2-20]